MDNKDLASEEITRKSLRGALKRWDSSQALGEHPLARLQVAEGRRLRSGYQDTVIGRGIAVRDVLMEAIKGLRPEEGEPDTADKRWRPYLILSQQYVHGRRPDYVSAQLDIARSTYNHEQARALDALADLLYEWEHDQALRETKEGEIPTKGAAERVTPFLAPPRPPYTVVGREGVLRELKRQLTGEGGSPIAAIHGLPGVGKTTLAIEIANDEEILEHFEDGVLWAGLGRRPDLLALLSHWGGALGLSMDEMASLVSAEERARAIHAAIGMRRMLLVIDDVWDVANGLTFKVGGPHCAYLITTRIPGVALEFAGQEVRPIQELEKEDGLELLAQFIPGVVKRRRDRIGGLVESVGGLPLALVLMGRYLQREARSGQVHRLERALERLRRAEERMKLGQAQSPLDQQPSLPISTPLSLQTVIAISDEALADEPKGALRALSVFPPKPNTFPNEAAVYVSNTSLDAIESLVDYGLLEGVPPDRLMLHPTVAEYAGLKPGEKTPAMRFVDFFLRIVEEKGADYGLLEPENQNILASLRLARDIGMPGELVRLANAFLPFEEYHGSYGLAEMHLTWAIEAARHEKDVVGLATALNYLGKILQRRGEYVRAEGAYGEAHALSIELADEVRQSTSLQGLGVVALNRGNYGQAESHFSAGLSLARKLENPSLVSAFLANLGVLHFNQGAIEKAKVHFQDGLKLGRSLEDLETVCALLTNLGAVAAREGEYGKADAFFQEALELARRVGRRATMISLLTNLGTLANDRKDFDVAESYFKEAVALAREMGDRASVSHLLANLGSLATAQGDLDRARAYVEEGLVMAREMGHLENVCHLLVNLGVISKTLGASDRAQVHLQEALSLAQEMGLRRYRAAILCNLGEIHLENRRWDEAEVHYEQAHQISQQISSREWVGVSAYGMARAASDKGNREGAARWGREALMSLQDIRHPKAEEVEAWLDGLDGPH